MTARGSRAWAWTPSLPGSGGGQDLRPSPWHSPGPQDMCCPGAGPVPRTGGRLALRPSGLGVWLECCAWREGPRGARPAPFSRLRGAGCRSPTGVRPRPGFQEMAVCHCPWLSVPPGKRARYFSARDQESQDCDPFAHRGQGSPPATMGGRPRGPMLMEPRASGREADWGTQAAPWWADWQADWGWSLWSLANAGAYCRGCSWA